ncbi:uncharacterized protein METZ01_LOCUS360009, partial [marine metagenome]
MESMRLPSAQPRSWQQLLFHWPSRGILLAFGMPSLMLILSLALAVSSFAQSHVSKSAGNRLVHLEDPSPFYPHRDFPKLITPQWVGEDSVEAVVTLGIDDMRGAAKYEQFLRPILE